MALAESGFDTSPEDWRVLRLLALYRLALATGLIALYHSGYSAELLNPGRGYYIASVAYGLAGALLLLPLLYRIPRLAWQVHLHFAVDVLAIAALCYVSGGVSSGLAMLLIVPVLGFAQALSLRMMLVQSAGATLALLGEELLRQLGEGLVAAEFTQTGILGLVLFLTGGVANALAQRARRSEALAERTGRSLADLARLNETIIERMQSGVAVVDGERHLRTLNAAAREWLGVGPGVALNDILPLRRAFEEWQANEAQASEPLVLHVDAEPLIARFTRLGGGRGSPVLLLLEPARAVQEQAQQMKLAALGRLSASIAHEIRNPLSAISHAGQLLAESTQRSDEDQKLLEVVLRQSVRLDKIVKDVLSLSRREAASGDTFSLKPWLTQAVAQYLEGEGARRVIEVSGADDLRVRFDASHLQQVLGNLWDNSFRHGGDGVRVSLTLARSSSGGPVLDVRDDGPGIPEPLRERIFEPFFTTAGDGTGLGLYLARELCAYNQARLSHVPQRRGACFRINFTEA